MSERASMPLPGKPGSHSVYFADDGRLTVEWYDHGDHAPYESANMLHFSDAAARALLRAIGADGELCEQASVTSAVAGRFQSYFEVRAFAEEHAIAFDKEVDFLP